MARGAARVAVSATCEFSRRPAVARIVVRVPRGSSARRPPIGGRRGHCSSQPASQRWGRLERPGVVGWSVLPWARRSSLLTDMCVSSRRGVLSAMGENDHCAGPVARRWRPSGEGGETGDDGEHRQGCEQDGDGEAQPNARDVDALGFLACDLPPAGGYARGRERCGSRALGPEWRWISPDRHNRQASRWTDRRPWGGLPICAAAAGATVSDGVRGPVMGRGPRAPTP
jgi:hypothetical protein